MKLIPLIILTLSLAVDNKAHEHYTFPPQFHSGMFTSEKNPYLPPEAHSPLPYFQMNMNNMNKLQFPYLPPTATKAPLGYPSPYPMMITSTLRPIKIENDDDDEDDKPTTQVPQYIHNKFNRTQRIQNQMAERREMRPIPKSFQNPIDRIDTKMPFQFNSSPDPPKQSVAMQTMTPRSISIMDIQRDHSMDQMKARDHSMDQIKAASFLGGQYVSPQPGIYISSTTETAIPILRLSNEMDLDGSFSYEALGADQTHYVQHSRMENAAGKDEQVVEGSYSYVGDNGKTYTVHYVADANGFRASGDHLPVAPPVPEIIQRAIQYNLAEESKKPPHLKSWNEDQQENELSETEKRHHFAIAPPRLSSLFTGKTPESFSHSFSQPSNTQNNLVAAASSQSSIQTAIDFSDQMQTKQNSGTISPQITFLASQGAHVPSVNAPQQQQVNRIFTTEKSTMPQLINYEANMKEHDLESNKALWRWQYGINANDNHNDVDKKSISRSFGADDIVINFNDMSSEQYTKMIKEQMESNTKENLEPQPLVESAYTKENDYYADYKSNPELDYQSSNDNLKPENQYSTERMSTITDSIDSTQVTVNENQYDPNKNYRQHNTGINEHSNDNSGQLQNQDEYNSNKKYRPHNPNTNESLNNNSRQLQHKGGQTSRPKLITQQQFIPQSQTVTQTYNYVGDNFVSRKTKTLNSDTSDIDDMLTYVLPLDYKKYLQYNTTPENKEIKNETTMTVTPEITTTLTDYHDTTKKSNLLFTDFIVPENKQDFKPFFKFNEPQAEQTTTTTEASIEDTFENNIFLKNLFRNNNYDFRNNEKSDINKKYILPVKPFDIKIKPIDTRGEKHSKYIQHQNNNHNENKIIRKPMDIGDIINYVARNQFESSKVKSAPKQVLNNLKQKNDVRNHAYDPVEGMMEDNYRNHRILQRQEELHGAIKNYKVLQRNNNSPNVEQDDIDTLRRNLNPPPLKPINLPPLGRAGPSMKSYLPPIYV